MIDKIQMSDQYINIETFVHPSTTDPNVFVVSMTGIDITESGNGYTVSDLRTISRQLQNIADHLEHSNNAASTKPLFEMRV